MKKIRLALCMMMIMLLGFSTVSHADEKPRVTFDGSSELKYNQSTTNFGTNFQNMRPGETREQDIVLKNESDREVDFFMTAETIQAFEDFSERSGAAYQIKLTVTQDDNEELIYGTGESEAIRIGGNEDGLKDMNGNLTDWFMVATLGQNEKAVLTMEVYLDGESHTNQYQAADGIFEFVFQVSYDDPETEETVLVRNIRLLQSVQTGDTANIILYVVMAALAIAGAIGFFVTRKKSNNKK